MVSYNTWMWCLNQILHWLWIHCVNMFRIDSTTFQSICFDLETQYELKPLKRMNVIEKDNMFHYTLALGASNRKVNERF